jgi:hypothetical protein
VIDTAFHRRIHAEIASIERLAPQSDSLSNAIYAWKDNLKESLALCRKIKRLDQEEAISLQFARLLEELLVDNETSLPLDDSAVLWSDGNTYNGRALKLAMKEGIALPEGHLVYRHYLACHMFEWLNRISTRELDPRLRDLHTLFPSISSPPHLPRRCTVGALSILDRVRQRGQALAMEDPALLSAIQAAFARSLEERAKIESEAARVRELIAEVEAEVAGAGADLARLDIELKEASEDNARLHRKIDETAETIRNHNSSFSIGSLGATLAAIGLSVLIAHASGGSFIAAPIRGGAKAALKILL